MSTVSIPKGTRDLVPPEIGQWQRLEAEVREYFGRFLYREIRTPLFEHSELFQRGIGDETEVVQKEMYTFTDKGGRSLTLRPENTASVVRAVIDNRLLETIFPPKFFYIGPMFRYDRPQKGRYRQFHQFGVEVFGDEGPGIDAEVIHAAISFLIRVGIRDVSLKLNSVGCPVCRPPYLEKLREAAQAASASLCEDCRRKATTNPLRIFDCKGEACGAVSATFPRITDHLCEACRDHFAGVRSHLETLGVSYQLDSRLVRGLDYYTRTTFEVTSGQLGAQNALLGGGRYDNLFRELGGGEIPGIGFAAGMERLILHLPADEIPARPVVFIATQAPALLPAALKTAATLWHEGIAATLDYHGRNLKKQLHKADRTGARFTLVLGETEAAAGRVAVKDMISQEQIELAVEELVPWLKARF
ncbi:MAG TPA: histidine--tRNA ligase [Candidatus Aminicenantes bacterium]|nr:histidine--tRNA ligase [Candidatus Aminicenantes bacterium]